MLRSISLLVIISFNDSYNSVGTKLLWLLAENDKWWNVISVISTCLLLMSCIFCKQVKNINLVATIY